MQGDPLGGPHEPSDPLGGPHEQVDPLGGPMFFCLVLHKPVITAIATDDVCSSLLFLKWYKDIDQLTFSFFIGIWANQPLVSPPSY